MSKIGFAPNIKNITLLISILSIIGCAEIGAPPGGEVDRVKPRVLSTIPINGSTEVPIDNQIIINFSEQIKKPATQKPIYISPRLETEPNIKWKSDKVIISLADSFQVDQTYIISFADGLQDLRNNPIDSGSIIAFTTGEKLATGAINGFVVDKFDKPKPNTVVALFDKSDFDRTNIDSLYPLYLGVSSLDGYFSFQYIPDGNYQVVAFTDNNKNELYDFDKELFGLPYEKTILDSTHQQIQKLTLALTNYQGDSLKVLSARQTDNNQFKIQFNQNVIDNAELKFHDSLLTLTAYSDSSQLYRALFMNSDSTNPQSMTTYFGELPIGNFQLNVFSVNDFIVFDSVRVKEIKDKTKPFMRKFHPGPLKIFKDSLNMFIQFSEPIDTTQISPETFYFIDADSNVIIPQHNFTNQSLCQFSSDFITDELDTYSLNISEFDIIDLAGIPMGDSTSRRTINFINADSLGIIMGLVVDSLTNLQNQTTVLQFKNISTLQKFSLFESSGNFTMQLPQGKYLLSGFIDKNNNRKRDYGKLSPFEYAEPFATYPDTIQVRARFESTDIRLEFK